MTHHSRPRISVAISFAIAVALGAAGSASAERAADVFHGPFHGPHSFDVRDDAFIAFSGWGPLTSSVLFNDFGATAVVSNTQPAHGTLKINADGSFAYTPNPGFKGRDSFTYT
ncbi:MAG TPA: Ig-like domain-containing protein, partial [Povalibacter sp.]|nr:Ig-like domain-containing protein [Povalibacter sp.]